MNKLLLQKNENSITLAFYIDNKLYDFMNVKEEKSAPSVGDIYHAKVIRIMKGLNSCFVRLDDNFDAFMEMKTRHNTGDTLLVQVKRPAFDKKQAMVSSDIELVGNYVTLKPGSLGAEFSKKLDFEDRKRLTPYARDGVVFRTSCKTAPIKNIEREMDYFLRQTEKAERDKKAAPSMYLKGRGEAQNLLDEIKEDINTIYTNIEGFSHKNSNVVYTKEPFLDSDAFIQLKYALRRRIQLKSGLDLVFDPTEALTVIDINTAKGDTRHDSAFETNMLAVKEIARLMRLRSMGGIVLIDCIDMNDKLKRAEVLQALRDELKNDRVKTTVHGFTKLGLIELTRQRKEDRKDAENMRCPTCHGSGIRDIDEWKDN